MRLSTKYKYTSGGRGPADHYHHTEGYNSFVLTPVNGKGPANGRFHPGPGTSKTEDCNPGSLLGPGYRFDLMEVRCRRPQRPLING
jgi:hypothetical protein